MRSPIIRAMHNAIANTTNKDTGLATSTRTSTTANASKNTMPPTSTCHNNGNYVNASVKCKANGDESIDNAFIVDPTASINNRLLPTRKTVIMVLI